MREQFRNMLVLLILASGGFFSQIAFAGMPSISLSDVAAMRFESISFFVFVLLGSAFAIQVLWNWLRRDFSRLPRLTYAKACGIVVLWGLLFVIVLTMISGARELLTPGAWEKVGLTYRLKKQNLSQIDERELKLREVERKHLEQLADLLALYAVNHGGNYPESQTVAEIPPARWLIRPHGEIRFSYTPGLQTSDTEVPLAYSPMSDGKPIPVLLAGGEITQLDLDEIIRRVGTHKP